ncbi:hypothetical protein QCA50_006401 [Cerrena zonata]|uniref:Uncharacterized protein n=1 Tax=Cerrena zonata TaxID=2478898 RepID=A0AAW0GDZ8_9APHY
MTTQEYSIVQDDTLGQTILFQGPGGACVTLFNGQQKDNVRESEKVFKLARTRYHCTFMMNGTSVPGSVELEIAGSRNVFQLARAISLKTSLPVVLQQLGIVANDRGRVIINRAHVTDSCITVHLDIVDHTYNLVQVWGPPPA